MEAPPARASLAVRASRARSGLLQGLGADAAPDCAPGLAFFLVVALADEAASSMGGLPALSVALPGAEAPVPLGLGPSA